MATDHDCDTVVYILEKIPHVENTLFSFLGLSLQDCDDFFCQLDMGWSHLGRRNLN